MKQKLILLISIILWSSRVALGQFAVSPNGVLVDSITGKDYVVIEKEGSQANLFDEIKKKLFLRMVDPQKSVSTVENEMISLRVKLEGTTKYAGINGKVGVIMNLKFQFKDNKIRMSGAWTETSWMGNDVDVFTFLSKGGLKVYNSKGEIKNQKRLREYNNLTNVFLQSILKEEQQEEW